MAAIPSFLTQAAANVAAGPPEWTARATRECTGALRFFGTGIARLMQDEGISASRFRDAADGARNAFAAYRSFLEADVRARPTDGYGCGGGAFDMYMTLGHELPMSGEEIERYAREQFASARRPRCRCVHIRCH